MCIVCVGEMMARLQVVCVTSLTGDDGLETKAAQDSLAVRQAACADVDAVCAKSVSYTATHINYRHCCLEFCSTCGVNKQTFVQYSCRPL